MGIADVTLSMSLKKSDNYWHSVLRVADRCLSLFGCTLVVKYHVLFSWRQKHISPPSPAHFQVFAARKSHKVALSGREQFGPTKCIWQSFLPETLNIGRSGTKPMSICCFPYWRSFRKEKPSDRNLYGVLTQLHSCWDECGHWPTTHSSQTDYRVTSGSSGFPSSYS